MSALTFGARRLWRVDVGVVRALGLAALGVSVVASWWIAVGAADGHYLLLLSTGTNPSWIDGPLHSLGVALSPSSFSAALIALVGGYLVALACAGSAALPLRAVLVAAVAANLAFTLGPTIVSTDVFGYIAYAREAAAHGLNPYLSSPSAIPHDPVRQYVYWKHQTSPYGPLFTFLSAPLGLVSIGAALWTFKALAGLASIALAVLVADVARRRGLSPAHAAVFVGLNPVLLVWAVSGAHNDLLAIALVALAFALALRERESFGAGAAVAAGAVKLTVGLALPFMLVWARRRARGVAAGGGDASGVAPAGVGAGARAGLGAGLGAGLALVAIGVPTLVLFGPHFIDQLHRIATDRQFDIGFSGPDRFAVAIGTPIDTLIRTLATGAAIGVGLWMIIRAWRGADPVAAAGWAFLALLCAIASLAPWYLVWLLPLAAWGRSRSLRAAALLATVYLVAVHLPVLGGQPWLTPAGGGAGAVASVSGIDQLHGSRAGVGEGKDVVSLRRGRARFR